MSRLPYLGIGIGYRNPLRRDLLRNLDELDFLEIVSDAFMRNPKALEALASLAPCIPHSLNLSVGSTVEPGYLEKLKRLVDITAPPWHTDHLAFTQADGISIGHLAPVAYTDESLRLCIENIRLVQKAIDRPFALETITMPFYWPNNTIEEHEFLTEITRQTGCYLLLDLENVRINGTNHGRGGRDLIDRLPLERVAQIHLAGGLQRDGLDQDTHSQPVSEATWSLLEYFCERSRPPGVLIERDSNFPPIADLLAEVRRARRIVRRGAS